MLKKVKKTENRSLSDFSKDSLNISLNKRKLRNKIISGITVGAIAMGSIVSAAALGKTATITDGENVKSLITFSSSTDDILETAGVIVGDDDLVVRNDGTKNIDITLYRAFDVNISIDGQKKTATFNRGTVKDALSELEIEYDSDDIITPKLDTELSENMDIEVQTIIDVFFSVDGKRINFEVPLDTTVGDVLEEYGIELGEDDIISRSLTDILSENDEVVINRVSYKTVTEKEKVSYKTVEKETDELEAGTKKVSVKGSNGERTIVTREKYIDGDLDSSEVISKDITKEPVDEVVLIGTKKKQEEVQKKAIETETKPASGDVTVSDGILRDANGNSIPYSRVITGTCTAYSYSTGNITATGLYAQYGRVAVNPNVIPYGTKLYIASPDGSVVYGYCVAADTGGALMDGSVLVDLFYNTDDECFQFGRRTMNVYVLS